MTTDETKRRHSPFPAQVLRHPGVPPRPKVLDFTTENTETTEEETRGQLQAARGAASANVREKLCGRSRDHAK